MNFTGRNVHTSLPSVVGHILTEGTGIDSRNGECKELLGESITLLNPWERFSNVPHRNMNPAALIADTMWVLAGRNDVKWLEGYLPRAKDFSDDGETWRAGYGPRLRNWRSRVDQLAEAYGELKTNPESRRVVLSNWDPSDDWVASKDVPCNDTIQFLNRQDKLHTFVYIRSNDVMWGWSGINTFEWSMMAELMAHSLNVAQGPITYFIGSLHLYDQHFQRAQKIAKANTLTNHPYQSWGPTRFQYTVGTMDDLLAEFFLMEEGIRGNPDYILDANYNKANEPWLRAIDIYWRQQNRDVPMGLIDQRVIDTECWRDIHWVMGEWVRHQRYLKSKNSHNPARSLATLNRGLAAGPVVMDECSSLPLDSTVLQTLRDLEFCKSQTYGNSWKKYGEMGSIFPNLARKYDRLHKLVAMDYTAHLEETLVDTIADLAVYAMKYYGYTVDPEIDEGMEPAIRKLVEDSNNVVPHLSTSGRYTEIVALFDHLEWLLGFKAKGVFLGLDKADTVISIADTAVEWLEQIRTADDDDPSWELFQKMVDRLKAEQDAHTNKPAVS